MRLIAVDMDGTLLTPRLEITTETALAVRSAQEHGICVAVATGRPYQWARRKLAEAGLVCPIIGSNGAELYSGDGERISTIPIPSATFERIHGLLEESGLYYEVYSNQGVFTEQGEAAVALRFEAVRREHPDWPEAHWQRTALERFAKSGIRPVERYADIWTSSPGDKPDEIYKLLVCSYEAPRLHRCRTALLALPELALSSSAGNNVEITHRSAQKGWMLQTLAGLLGIPLAETAAIGDNHNDAQMLQMAGLPIAMGNAEAAIRRLCRYTTRSNEEHGVAYAIERIMSDWR